MEREREREREREVYSPMYGSMDKKIRSDGNDLTRDN